ncbi:Methyl viologen resistance protein SmvA [Mycobacterium marinum]|nr:Methyl viologen resistance protein SmvA [Mycobacterium marinum]AXN48454.1 Methyl viologen resistance protein SmvA [Mycobacterium marinum]RFZ07371.1 Methyl viologen resistance protein SmvA [Mycobacterium marinum]RFZ10129.1 Methyl viologen resistance protein SmvA [Mycobacterium marinum]RFZ20839.1 Methyl viologen resistance protein SmvA [Mycobacterium marinum]
MTASPQVNETEGRPVVGRPGAVLFTVCAALFLVVVDVTVLHVAAPRIAEELSPSPTEFLWIVDIYPLIMASLMLMAGAASDRFGRKRLLMTGLVIFGLVSIPAAFAATPLMLILARSVMAVGAAMILPATVSLLRVAFPDRAERMRAVGIWSAVSAVGAAIGPLMGGLLVEYFWWGAIFLINVPLALLVLLLVWRLVPESRSQARLVLDGLSVSLSIVAVLTSVLAIKQATHHGIDPAAVGYVVIAGVGLWWFIRRQISRQRRGIEPLLNVHLFTRAPFTIAVLAVLLAVFSIVGLDLVFAQYLQNFLGFTPIKAALLLTPMAAATVVGSLSAHLIVGRCGTRVAIGAGLGLTASALLPLLTLGHNGQLLVFVGSLAVVGFALDVVLVSANDAIISAVSEDYVGQAAGVEEVAYDLGGGLGIAVLGSVLTATYTAAFDPISGLTDSQLATAQESIRTANDLADATTAPALASQIRIEAHTAFLAGFHTTIVVAIAILAVAAVAAGALLSTKTLPEPAGQDAPDPSA